jgi:hypothetical protein
MTVYNKYDCNQLGIFLYFFNISESEKFKIISFFENTFSTAADLVFSDMRETHEKFYDFLIENKMNIMHQFPPNSYCLSFHGVSDNEKNN